MKSESIKAAQGEKIITETSSLSPTVKPLHLFVTSAHQTVKGTRAVIYWDDTLSQRVTKLYMGVDGSVFQLG